MYSSPAITLLTFALGAAALHGIWLSTLCMFRPSLRWLSWALAGFSAYLLNYLLFLTGIIRAYPHALGVFFPLVYLTGPGLYFFVRSALHRDFRLRKIHAVHLLPFAFGWWQMRRLFLMPAGQKKEMIDWLLDPQALLPIRAVLAGNIHIYVLGGYAIAAWLVAVEFEKSARSEARQSIARWYVRFAWLFIGALFIDMAVKLLCSAWSIPGSHAEYVLALLPAILLHAVGYHALREGGGFRPIIPDASPVVKYKTSPLDPDRLETGKCALLHWMETERPYLNPGLKITDLAQQMHMPSHHLSQILNESIRLNFNDFVNAYRVGEAQRRLKNERYRHLSIEALGMDCGFSSKTTFNRAFKKITGETPGAYSKKGD